MNTVSRGAVAEMLVASELLKLDFNISMPVNHHSEYDLIADTGNKLVKIQVKRAYKTKNKGKIVLYADASKNRHGQSSRIWR